MSSELRNINIHLPENTGLPLDIPQNYFEGSERALNNLFLFEEEHSKFSTLSSLRKSEFVVPENYFSVSSDHLEKAFENSELPLLAAIAPQKNDLFGKSSEIGSERIDLAAEKELFASLYQLRQKDNFQVKEGYFDLSAGKLKPRSASRGKIISFSVFSRPAIAAACLILIAAGSALYFYLHSESKIDTDCHTLACLEKRELLDEKTFEQLDEDNLYEMVDVDELGRQISGDELTNDDSVKKEGGEDEK